MKKTGVGDNGNLFIISRNNNIAAFIIISMLLHAGLFCGIMQWAYVEAAQVRPLEVISVSILAAPAAQQASTSAPAKPEPAPPKPKLKPLPLPAQKIEKKTKAKEPEPSPAQADSTGDGQYSGPLSPYASYGQAARQGQPATEYQAGVVDAEAQKRMIINARDIYITLIDPLIKEGIEYPAVAQRRGWEGRVILHFIVGPDGYVSDIQVAKSSGFRMLDMAAIKHIQSIKFPPPPYPDLVLPVPVTFRLEEE